MKIFSFINLQQYHPKLQSKNRKGRRPLGKNFAKQNVPKIEFYIKISLKQYFEMIFHFFTTPYPTGSVTIKRLKPKAAALPSGLYFCKLALQIGHILQIIQNCQHLYNPF